MKTDGIINFLKSPGMTSHDAVGALRRISGIKKIGHTGTLDPEATGVLPICIGRATKMIEYLDKDSKRYRAEMILGVETDTQDIWGDVIGTDPEAASKVTREDAEKVLAGFIGEREQIPPSYSAVRINGKRLYEYAREGKEVEVKSRKIEITDIKLVNFDGTRRRVMFDVLCSKGTYVRTICRDAGAALGCGAAMSFLSRTGAGLFRLEDAVTLEDLEEKGIEPFLIPADRPLEFMPSVDIGASLRERFGHGNDIKKRDASVTGEKRPSDGDLVRVYSDGYFMGIAKYDDQKKRFAAEKVLFI